MNILLIEDDAVVASYLVAGLGESGHTVEHVASGDAGLECVHDGGRYDVLIVDRMLPGLDGLVLIETLRAEGRETPILVLSALGEVDDRVRGLRAGGDDYLSKPFAFNELLARLETLVRRARRGDSPPVRLAVADLELDLIAHTATRAGEPIRLQPREFRLLEYLVRHAGQVVTRGMLLEHVWEYSFDPQTNVIDVHISRLRAKIDKGSSRPLIHTLRGIGYKLGETP